MSEKRNQVGARDKRRHPSRPEALVKNDLETALAYRKQIRARRSSDPHTLAMWAANDAEIAALEAELWDVAAKQGGFSASPGQVTYLVAHLTAAEAVIEAGIELSSDRVDACPLCRTERRRLVPRTHRPGCPYGRWVDLIGVEPAVFPEWPSPSERADEGAEEPCEEWSDEEWPAVFHAWLADGGQP